MSKNEFSFPVMLESGPSGPLEFHSAECVGCGADVVVCIHGDRAAAPCSECGVFWSGTVEKKEGERA